MESRSPTLAGFRTAFRHPQFAVGEIVWRWSFGAAAVAAVLFCLWQYLDSLTVTKAETFLLGTGQPAFVACAIQSIFRGSAPRLVSAGLIVAVTFAAAWIIVASLSRRAIISSVAEHLRSRMPEDEATSAGHVSDLSLIWLSLFRVAVALAAVVGYVAAWMAAIRLGSVKGTAPGDVFAVFCAIIFLVVVAWLFLNWLLSFAAIFVVNQGCGALSAIAAAADCCMGRLGAVLAPSVWFGLAHLVLFCVAGGMSFFVLGFAAFLPAAATVAILCVIALVYFAVADFLYLGRLAAYIFLIEGMDLLPVPPPAPVPQLPRGSDNAGSPAHVDRDELILSDIPFVPESC